MEINRLLAHLKQRPEQLKQKSQSGQKIIGYFPGNYVPEEIIYAAGCSAFMPDPRRQSPACRRGAFGGASDHLSLCSCANR